MANILEYILSLNDKMSGKLKAIGVTSISALDKFAKLEKQSKDVSNTMNTFGNSIGSLRERLQLLRSEKDWIPQSEIGAIRSYNSEIKKLEKNIAKLDTINGSNLKRLGKDALASMPGSEFITNPLVAVGAAMVATTKSSFSFNEGMAKINATALLSGEELNKLGVKLQDVSVKYGADIGGVPDAFEKIISQLGEVNPSLQVFESALKGAKATGAGIDVVSGALAQTKSILGDNKVTADDVLNTFLAAKRVGAGEFADFANYMPNLIASGKALGVTYKNTAGLFAYMTGKGFSADKAATLMDNVFSTFGKIDIQDNLKNQGIKIFDKDGAMRDVQDIFSDLNKKMAGMSDEGKSNFLGKMGIVDKEARSGIVVMTNDMGKLRESISAANDAAANNEIGKALKATEHPLQKIRLLWSKLQIVMIKLGSILGQVLVPVLGLAFIALDGLNVILDGAISFFAKWFDALASGNPIIWGITMSFAALTIGIALNYAWTKRAAIWDGIHAAAISIKTGVVNLSTAAWWKNNAAMLASPITWIIASIIALIAAIGYVVYKTDGWGKAWEHTIKAAELIFKAYVAGVKLYFNTMINSLMIGLNAIKKGWYEFKKTIGVGDDNDSIIAQINADTEARKKAIISGAEKVKSLSNEAALEFLEAGKSLKWNDKTDVVADLKKQFGIGDISIPGVAAAPAAAQGGGNKTEGGSGGVGKKSNEAIATGGAKSTIVNIHIDKQIETFTVTAGNSIKETAAKIRDVVIDEMTRAVAMGASLGNG